MLYRGSHCGEDWGLSVNEHSQDRLFSVWSLSVCSSSRILSMVSFLSCSSWSLVSRVLATDKGACWGRGRGGTRTLETSLARDRLSACLRLSGTTFVCESIGVLVVMQHMLQYTAVWKSANKFKHSE